MTETKQPTILELMGLDNLSEPEQNAVLEKFGNLIIEASIGQLLLELTPEKVDELQVYINNVTPEEDIFAYLLRTFPDFQSIVEKQIAGLESEIKAVYG